MDKFLKYLLTLLGIFSVLSTNLGVVFAATSPFSQTDWSGGSGQTNFTDATKYDSGSNVVTSVAGEVSLSHASGWFNTAWGYRKKITFDNSAQAQNLTDFPVLVKLTTSNTDYSKFKSAGADLRFTDSDGTTLLKYEIESWNASGNSFVWVKVPQIDASSNTDNIYMYYGNSAASDAQDVNNVWNSSAKMVLHLKESGACPVVFADSTSAGNNGACQDSPSFDSAGQINGARTLDGIDDFISTTNQITNPQDLTLSVWFNTTVASGHTIFGLENSQNGTNAGGYDRHIYMDNTGKIRFAWYDGSEESLISNNTLNDGTWHQVTATLTGGVGKLYIDGVLNATINGGVADNFNGWWRLGSYKLSGWTNASDGYFTGSLDEARYYDSANTPEWVAASYKSEADTLNTLGSEQQYYNASGTLTSSIFDSGQGSDWGILTFNAATPANTVVTVKARTSNSATMSGATDFSSCATVTSGSDLSGASCVTDGTQYIQYQLTLTTTDPQATPVFQDLSIVFAAQTTNNPSSAPASTASSPSAPSLPTCDNKAPDKAPEIVKYVAGETSADISFKKVEGTVTEYVISYGFDKTASNFGGTFGAPADPIIKQSVNNLTTGTTFYFKIRAGNGCATGPWSEPIKLSTTGFSGLVSKTKSPVNQVQKIIEKLPLSTPSASVTPEKVTQIAPPEQKSPDLSFFVPKLSFGFLNAFSNALQNFGISAKSGLALLYDRVFHAEGLMIRDVQVAEKGNDFAVITWTTNQPATSKVNFGDSYDYGKDIQSPEKVTEHKIVITGLEKGKTYYYEVMSQSSSGYSFDARHEFKME